MVFYIIARGNLGFTIHSENNEVTIGVLSFDIQVPTETLVDIREVNGKKLYNGRVKFETNNEIVIKDKIAYIR
jgi:hypothetical protein